MKRADAADASQPSPKPTVAVSRCALDRGEKRYEEFIIDRWDVGLAPGEVPEHLEIVHGPARAQHGLAIMVAIGAREPAIVHEPLAAVAVEHLGPQIAVITSAIAAGRAEDVVEIGRPVPRRHQVDFQPQFLERLAFEGGDLLGRVDRGGFFLSECDGLPARLAGGLICFTVVKWCFSVSSTSFVAPP